MKYLILLAIITAAIVAGLALMNSAQSYRNLETIASSKNDDIHFFDPKSATVTGVEETKAKMNGLILKYKKNIRSYSVWNLVLNLLVTIISGLTALISTISTIKNNAVTKKAGITIAIVTFAASVLSFSQGQINTSKEAIEKNKIGVIKLREEMESLSPEELVKQLPKINRTLDENF